MIHSGSTDDRGFSGGSVWGPTNDPSLAALPTDYQCLRFGPSFVYEFAADIGLSIVRVGLLEPNATRAGQRIMSVAVNGRTAAGIDIFKAAGARTSLILTFYCFVDSAQPTIKLSFVGTVGNAVVSWIDWNGGTWEGV